ncbi:MAG: hypothetical protein LBB67_04580 [Oscillospiraceae bacterium]|nr:hypothetical protein [Oscillospiraceae bacterium]
MTTSKNLAVCGIFTGLSLALLYLVSFIPTLDLALPAAAGLLLIVIVLELGRGWAFGVFAACAAVAFFVVPNKSVTLYYAGFFGYYPILKSFLEQKLPRVPEWIVKILFFNAAIIGMYFLALKFLGLDMGGFPPNLARYLPLILLVLANVTFLIYDIMVIDRVAILYNKRLQAKFRRFFH